MKKIIRITESKLSEIISKIISEQSITGYVDPTTYGGNRPPAPKAKPQLPKEKWEERPWDRERESEMPPDIANEKKKVTMAVQQRLGIKVDGIYGNGTANAVRQYQKSIGQKPTGIIYNGDPTQITLRVGFGNVKMLSNLGTTPMSDPIKKPVAPVAPPRDTTPISSIPSRPAKNVNIPSKNDGISPDYRQRQGNY